MKPRDLIDRLCAVYGVDNPNQLADKLVGYTSSTLYRWHRGEVEPDFEHTIDLLALAGLLQTNGASSGQDAAFLKLERLLEAAAASLGSMQVTLREVRAVSQQPPAVQ